jgi:aminopeptidase N
LLLLFWSPWIQELQSGEGPDARWQGIANQSMLSYAIEVTPDFDAKEVAIEVQYHLLVEEDLAEIRLHAKPGPKWKVQFFHANGSSWAHQRQGEFVVLSLPAPLAKNSRLEFGVHLEGAPPDGLYFRNNRYGQAMLFTDHFSSRARGWLPSEDHPSDRAHFTLKINGVENLEVVGSGIDPDKDGVLETTAEMPTYLLAFAVGPYARVSEKGDERLVAHFIYDKDKAKARMGLKFHAAWMETMEKTFGPYGYGKYCVAQVPTRWGGVENAGNTFVMERLFDGRDRGIGTLAHELVHQWFGDTVGYSQWHDAWLSEGFASYFGPWLHAELGGGVPLAQAMSQARSRWLRAKTARGRPVRWLGFEQPDDLFGSSSPNTYQKGAWILHMLRGELGDPIFFKGLAIYYQQFAGKGVASQDLIGVMEKISEKSLERFFHQWLDLPDCPRLEISWQDTELHVRQVQEIPFAFRLPVAWTDGTGKRHKNYFAVTDASHIFKLPESPRSPTIDPDVELLFERL